MLSSAISTFETAISIFLENWKDRPEYVGALLTGSYATNTSDGGSDIDLRIFLNNDVTYTEVGECMLEGQCLSFMVMPLNMYRATFKSDLKTISKYEIRRVAVGKVLEDKGGAVKGIIRQAKQMLSLPIDGFLPVELVSEKLSLSRKYKVFKEMPTNDAFRQLAYFDLLKGILELYAKYLKADVPAFIKKWSRFFTNEKYRTANQYVKFPDKKFINYFLQAAGRPDASNIEQVYEYVMYETGGTFDTNFLAKIYTDKEEIELFEFG